MCIRDSNRPLDSRRIVSVCRHVGKRTAAGNGRGAVRTVQERYGLAAGNGCVRAERSRAGAACDALFNRPQNRVIVIRIRTYIGERVCTCLLYTSCHFHSPCYILQFTFLFGYVHTIHIIRLNTSCCVLTCLLYTSIYLYHYPQFQVCSCLSFEETT